MRQLYLIAAFVVCISINGCSDGAISDPDQIVFPPSDVSFARHVQPLLTLSCAFSGCHDSERPENNYVALTSWVGVRNIRVVNLGGDTACGLIRVVFGRQFHSGIVRVNANQREGLKTWVLEGAQNN